MWIDSPMRKYVNKILNLHFISLIFPTYLWTEHKIIHVCSSRSPKSANQKTASPEMSVIYFGS